MKRLPTALAITALVVAFMGATGAAQAVVATFAANAGKLRGYAPSKKAKRNTVVVRGANGKIDRASIPLQARGARGPEGPAGATGAQGPKGDKGDKGDMGERGLPGTARAYGRVSSTGALTRSFNATVRRPGVGKYCITVPGVTPAESFALANTDSNGSGGGYMARSYTFETAYCNAGEFAVLVQRLFPCGGNPPTVICEDFIDGPFVFVIP